MSNMKLWITLFSCLWASCLLSQITIDFTKTPDDGGNRTYILDQTKDLYKQVTGNQNYVFDPAHSQAVYVDPNTNETILMLYAGDANSDGQIKFQGSGNDGNEVYVQLLTYNNPETGDVNSGFSTSYADANGYFNVDLNMNGNIKYQGQNNDPNFIFTNLLLYPLNTSFTTSFAFLIEQIPDSSQN